MRSFKLCIISVMLIMLAGSSAVLAQNEPSSTVIIKNLAFNPSSLTVPAGTVVTWVNDDNVGHTVTGDTGLFDSGIIGPGGDYTFTFENPGTYAYHCAVHPNMRGQIVATSLASSAQPLTAVQAPPSAVPPETVTGYAQFYTAAPATPALNLTAPQIINIQGAAPAYVYFGGLEGEVIPYSEYSASPSYLSLYTLWIWSNNAWIRYAQVPRGASISLLAIAPNGANGDMYEVFPSGRVSQSNYTFFDYNSIGFYADRIGRHVLFFTMGDVASNPVIIDVVEGAPQPGAYP